MSDQGTKEGDPPWKTSDEGKVSYKKTHKKERRRGATGLLRMWVGPKETAQARLNA